MVTVLLERRKLHLKVLPEVDTNGNREKKADLLCSRASGEFRTRRHHILWRAGVGIRAEEIQISKLSDQSV